MELSEREQEILRLYRADKKRKRKKRMTLIALLLLLSVGGYGVYQYVQSMPTAPKEKMEEKTTDTVKPKIELKEKEIEVFKGAEIEYEKYIKKAPDNKDGDLSKEVHFNKINTNELGEYVVRYRVKDKAGNEGTATLKVVVKEKEKPKEESKEEAQQPVQQRPVQQAPQEEPQQTPPPQPAPPVTKYFMFTDGYTMENVTSACQSELSASGRSGVCTPIQDESGVYTGMRLDLY
ncbi:DUF5011 domain-containing protein [[Clostridium] innocuum]|nr:DUF5011 domain-containing protein [[Clostridium] innocuum]